MVAGTFTLGRKATSGDGVWYHDSGELTDDMSAMDALGGTLTPTSWPLVTSVHNPELARCGSLSLSFVCLLVVSLGARSSA
jgi:hypothetical protein